MTTVLIKNKPGISPSKTTKVVAFGDSWTAGSLGYAGFSSRLGNYYTAVGVNQGMPGKTSNDGVANLTTKVLNASPNYCLLNWGINDCADATITTAIFKSNVQSMIDQMIAANITVILWTSMRRDMAAIGASGASMNDLMQQIRDLSVTNNLKLFDFAAEITPLSDYLTQGAWWADALHMNQRFHDYAWFKFRNYLIGQRKLLAF